LGDDDDVVLLSFDLLMIDCRYFNECSLKACEVSLLEFKEFQFHLLKIKIDAYASLVTIYDLYLWYS